MKDRNGNVLKCRGCGSEYHFIRECPKVKKHHLIGLVMDKVTDAEDVKVADIFSVAQDLPDDVWESIHGGMKDSETPQEKSDDHLDQIMFARLATNSDISHIFHAEKAAELMTNPYQTFLKPNTTDAYETFVCKNASSVNITERLKSEVIKIMKEGSNEFEGIMIDNGAAKSPSGLKAYIRYCAHTNSTPQVRASNRAFRGVGHGVQESLGVVPIRMPLGNQHMISFEVDLVDQDIPLIFGLEQHMAHSCSTNEYFKTFTHHPTNITVPIHYMERSKGAGGHFFMKWKIQEIFYTKQELLKLHKQFGHPSNTSLMNLLKRATPDKVTPEVKKNLEELAKKCKPCQEYGSRTSRFRVSMPMDEIIFNHEIEVDVLNQPSTYGL